MRSIGSIIAGFMLIVIPCVMSGFEVVPEGIHLDGDVHHFPGGFYLNCEDTVQDWTDPEGEEASPRYIVGFYRIEAFFVEYTPEEIEDSASVGDDVAELEAELDEEDESDSTLQNTISQPGGSGAGRILGGSGGISYMARFRDGFLFMNEDAEPGDSILGLFSDMPGLKKFFTGEDSDSNTPGGQFRPIPLHTPQD